MRFLFSLLFLLLSVAPGRSQQAFELTDRHYDVVDSKLMQSFEYFQDQGSKLSLQEVSQLPFRKLSNLSPENFDPKSTYWVRIHLKNKWQREKLWYFEVTDPNTEEVKVFQIFGKDTVGFPATGSERQFFSRQSDHKNFIFPIRFYESDSVWIYLAFKSTHLALNLSIRPISQFQDYALREYYYLGIFYGILLIMAVYNFFIYFSTRESVYLYYVAYVLCYCLNAFREDGTGFQFLWPGSPSVNLLVETFAPVLLIVSFVFYSRRFLFLDRFARRLNKLLTLSLILFGFLFFLNSYYFQTSWIPYFYLIPFLLIYFGGIWAWKKGNVSAGYFLLAFTFLVLCFTVFILRITDLLPTTLFTVYALNFGFLIEVVLFSYALGQRLKIGKEEKARMDAVLIDQLRENEKLQESLNKELEAKVQERTKELSEAMEELKTKNDQIGKLNKLLESDNKALNQDIKNITKARLLLKDLTLEEFQKIYPDEEACLKYLSEIKWEKEYMCKKCGNGQSSSGRTLFSRRCTRCGYDESVTSYTLFHKSKLPITTSFYLTYLVLANRNISSHELSEKLNLRQKTCWAFKKKILEAIGDSKSARLNSREWGRIFYKVSVEN